jgi:hypothetical protein
MQLQHLNNNEKIPLLLKSGMRKIQLKSPSLITFFTPSDADKQRVLPTEGQLTA